MPAVPFPARSKPPHRIQIEHLSPVLDCGRYPAKRTVGEAVPVAADIFSDGHDVLRAVVRWKAPDDDGDGGGDGDGRSWQETPLHPVDAHIQGVRWEGSFPVDALGRWTWTIEAWSDVLASWHVELTRKVAAGQDDLNSELAEGAVLLRAAAKRAKGADRAALAAAADAVEAHGSSMWSTTTPPRATTWARCSRSRASTTPATTG
ncbi:MAG TPA: maltotransferase domain-containing protein [Iamia sp.]|nr:maltotransferase domain-containing protein [Iamia sp.]HXH59629.1 maltotransferase domain-containing protein [Iamia sp.]